MEATDSLSAVVYLCVWIVYQTAVVTCANSADVDTITCDIPPVLAGDTATLTCKSLPRDWTILSVQRYPPSSSSPAPIVDCSRQGGAELLCRHHDSRFSYNLSAMVRDADRQVDVVMPLAGPYDQMLYKCQVPRHPRTNTCQFRLEQPVPDTNQQTTTLTVTAVILAVLLLITVVTAGVFYRWHYRKFRQERVNQKRLRQVEVLQADIDKQQHLLQHFEETMKTLTDKRRTLTSDKANLEAKLRTEREEIRQLENEITTVQSARKETNQKKKELEDINDEMRGTTKEA